MTDSRDPDSLLPEREASQLLSVSIRTLQAWRFRRVGPPFVRLGRAIRYARRALIEWINANTYAAK
jgi:hypothetical protein